MAKPTLQSLMITVVDADQSSLMEKIWSHSIGEAGLITPGHHKIQCGGWIEFDIPEGVVFHFDYWGP